MMYLVGILRFKRISPPYHYARRKMLLKYVFDSIDAVDITFVAV